MKYELRTIGSEVVIIYDDEITRATIKSIEINSEYVLYVCKPCGSNVLVRRVDSEIIDGVEDLIGMYEDVKLKSTY